MRPATVQGMRALALWAVLFAAYAATLGINAVGRSEYGGDEPRYLLVAESIVSDHDIDLTDEFATHAYTDFHPGPLRPQGQLILGRSMEPQGIGFALLIAPAYALGGATAVELFLAALAALGFVLAAAVARRMVPEPWASGAALVVGLSPLALAHATAVYPEAAAGTALAGAALCALRVRERPAFGSAVAGAALLAALPWLGPKYLLPAAPIAIVLVRWTARRGRRTAALAAAEIMVASVVVYATINDRLFGGLTPYAASSSGRSPTGADSLWEHLERLPRLAALWIDRDVGLLRWAPVLALSLFAAWLLWRSRRVHLARLVEARADAEAAAGLALAVWVAVLLVAAFAAPSIAGEWFAGRQLVAGLPLAAALCAWGLRHAPRTGAVLGALTLAASLWLALAFAFGDAAGWADHGTNAPLGPAVDLLPRSGVGSVWFAVAASVVAAALVALVAREWWRERQLAAA
jgi:hypothetical protein